MYIFWNNGNDINNISFKFVSCLTYYNIVQMDTQMEETLRIVLRNYLPPFLQGACWQSSMSTSQFRPV